MEQNKEQCIKGRLVALQEDGAYTNYVFEDMNTRQFIMCTRVPNWNGEAPIELQEGYVKFKDVEAGRDSYFDSSDGLFKAYQYTATYFLSFVPITHVLVDGFVTNKNQLKVS